MYSDQSRRDRELFVLSWLTPITCFSSVRVYCVLYAVYYAKVALACRLQSVSYSDIHK